MTTPHGPAPLHRSHAHAPAHSDPSSGKQTKQREVAMACLAGVLLLAAVVLFLRFRGREQGQTDEEAYRASDAVVERLKNQPTASPAGPAEPADPLPGNKARGGDER